MAPSRGREGIARWFAGASAGAATSGWAAGGNSRGLSLLCTTGCAGSAICGTFTGSTCMGWFIAIGRAGNCGRGNQVGQGSILLHHQLAWLNDGLPRADVVLIGHHNLLRRKLRISLLRTRPTWRLRLSGIHRRQILRNLVMDYRLVGRSLRQNLWLVEPSQVQSVNRHDNQRMSQE